jgi:hypothetical protein
MRKRRAKRRMRQYLAEEGVVEVVAPVDQEPLPEEASAVAQAEPLEEAAEASAVEEPWGVQHRAQPLPTNQLMRPPQPPPPRQCPLTTRCFLYR